MLIAYTTLLLFFGYMKNHFCFKYELTITEAVHNEKS